MRSLLVVFSAALLIACTPTPPAATGEDGGDAGEDAGPFGEDGGFVAPPTEACTGASTTCLWGTAATTGFTATAKHMEIRLFRGYPSAGSTPLATLPVALDGTWAFSGLAAWDHYFVQVLVDFGQSVSVAAVAGALAVPSTGPVGVQVPPVQLSVLQASQASGGLQLVSALAYVFDPSSGAAVSNASVAIDVGGAPQPLAWTSIGGGDSAYLLKFSSGTATQASYTVTTTLSGSSPSTWQLSSPTATLAPTLSAPGNGGSVPAGQPLTVAWPAVSSDGAIVQLFTQQSGAWTSSYQSAPDYADLTQQIVPATDVTAGPLLINVEFLLGSCPATSNGCVAAAFVAASQVTVQ